MENKIKLSDWAKANGKTYKQSWEMVERGEFPERFERTKTNRIFVIKEESKAAKKELSFVNPVFANLEFKNESKASSRRNRAATIERDAPFFHIENGIEPFQISRNGKSSGGSGDFLSVQDAIRLCQKAYWNFSIFRNTIDVMTEFSTNNIYLRGGTAKSIAFFNALWKKNNILDIQDRFYREYYRSSNVFVHRFDSILEPDGVADLNKSFGTKAAKNTALPIKYIILNPSDIVAGGNISFSSAKFFKVLNPYEISRLRNPQTDDDKEFLNSLPPETQKTIKSGTSSASVMVPLDETHVYSIFYKKQDYEPLAVPMGYPVLKDINWKEEMKEMDMAIARTTQRVILLVTMGYESKNGEYMVDAKTIQETQNLFSSESIGKVLVADFTTKAEFVIPPIAELLSPKKYEIVNEDIRMGLNNILVGKNEKFANQHIQVNLFIQRLKQAREVFLNQFLIPEMKRISKDLGFKGCPEPYFEEFDLKDENEFNRIITQLAQMGLLTAEETFTALESGRIPTGDESVLSQEEYKKLKDKGYYQPIVGGPATQMDMLDVKNEHEMKMQESAPVPAGKTAPKLPGQVGRKPGTKRPQSTKKISPIKASNGLFSLSKVKDGLIIANNLVSSIKSELLNKFELDTLNSEQTSMAETLAESIMINENINMWNKESIAKYINNPDIINDDRHRKITEIAYEHQISPYLAAVLYDSSKE